MTFFIKSTLIQSSILSLCLTLTACNDKYPKANMPDAPLEQPLEIIIEPKKVAMTATTAVGVKDDGTLWTWGTDYLLRKTRTGQDPTPTKVEGITDVVAVSAGIGHILMLKKDGSVWGWGSNYDGYVDPNDDNNFINEPRKIEGLGEVVDVVAGIGDSFFLTKQGEVYTIGENEKGWTNGVNQPNKIPIKIPNLTNIVRFESLGNVSVALNNQGEIYTTGVDWQSLGREVTKRHDHSEIAFYPADKVELPHKAVDFFVHGSSIGVLLETGEVWVWGAAPIRIGIQLPASEWVKKPIKHPQLNQIINIEKGSAVAHNGDLYIWGEQGFGKSKTSLSVVRYYHPIRIMQNVKPSELIYGLHTSAVLLENGELWVWGDNDDGKRGTGQTVKSFEKDYVLTPEKSLFTTH